MNTLHKALAIFGAMVLIVCTAWGGASLGTALANWTYPEKLKCELP